MSTRFRRNAHVAAAGSITGVNKEGVEAAKLKTHGENFTSYCPSSTDREHNESAAWEYLTHTKFAAPALPLKSGPSRILRRALGKAPTPDKGAWAAHHIIPIRDPRARTAQQIALRCKIHPNSVLNGVYLRGYKAWRDGSLWDDLDTDARLISYHPDTTYSDYMTYINTAALRSIDSDNECHTRREPLIETALDGAKHALIAGTLFGVELHEPTG